MVFFGKGATVFISIPPFFHPREMKYSALAILVLGSFGLVAIRATGPHPIVPPASTAPGGAKPLAAPLTARLELISDRLTLPTALTSDAENRLFVGEQTGAIRLIEGGKLRPEPVLDLQNVVMKSRGYDERGLLGLALHPDFEKNRKFYVYYSARSGRGGANHKSVIEEFRMKDATHADRASGRLVLEFDQPESNHNGGDLAFGPDGYLYITTGDGGGAGDRHGSLGNGQNLATLLGKILRIDVTKSPYGIPKDNPFVNQTKGSGSGAEPQATRPEIFAYGLRNPWRMSFDRQTGQLFTGDVGQNLFEEVNLIQKGGNYGWRIREGFHAFDGGQRPSSKLIEPIAEYPHGQEGISVAGGYVYRGKALPQLAGKYVFGDYIGPVYYLSQSSEGTWTRGALRLENKPAEWQVYSFGQDRAGEVYVLAVLPKDRGTVYRLAK